VSGPSETNAQYPGATVLPTAVGKPAVVMTSTSGQPYNLAAQTAGRVTLLYFGYTHCPDVCPINMALAAQAVRLMPAELRQQVDVLFVTTDPARDTPAVMRAWLDHFSPSFVGLVGSISVVHQAESAVGMPLSVADQPVSSGGYTVEHSGSTLVYAQDGQSHIQIDNTETPAQYATTLEHLIAHGFQAAS
jgi:protein SCO1/2